MKRLKQILIMVLVGMSVLAWAVAPQLQEPQNPVRRQNAQNNRTQNNQQNNQQNRSRRDTAKITAQPIFADDEEIPDSLLHPRWKIQRTQPITEEDLQRGSADFSMPDNIEQKVEYNDTLDRYIIGSKMGSSYLGTPIMMTAEEYGKWSERQMRNSYFRSKNEEVFESNGKEKFSFRAVCASRHKVRRN